MTKQANILDTLEAFYLEWVNDYLTVACMARDKCLTVDQTQTLITYGRDVHESRVDVIEASKLSSLQNMNNTH